jgi:hypothetical protein
MHGEVYASANKSLTHSNSSRFLFKGIVLRFVIAVRLSIVGVVAAELRQFCANYLVFKPNIINLYFIVNLYYWW